MEKQIKIKGNGKFASVPLEFIFDMNLISFSDLKTIYSHFNLRVEDGIKTKRQLIRSMEPEDNDFVRKMAYVSALICHDCLRCKTVRVCDTGEYQFYHYTEFNKYIKFEFDFTYECEKFCDGGSTLESMIDDYGLKELAPIFEKYPFVKSIINN